MSGIETLRGSGSLPKGSRHLKTRVLSVRDKFIVNQRPTEPKSLHYVNTLRNCGNTNSKCLNGSEFNTGVAQLDMRLVRYDYKQLEKFEDLRVWMEFIIPYMDGVQPYTRYGDDKPEEQPDGIIVPSGFKEEE